MQSIGNILRFNFESPNKEITNIAKESETFAIWPRVFEKFCPEYAERTMPLSFKGGVFTVAALDDTTADTIQFCRDRLMEEMNMQLGRRMVWWIACER
jgi:hypothetical protein